MPFDPTNRRQFITLLGGVAAWPLAARAQQEPIQRIGILMDFAADDPEGQARLAAFLRGLAELGWIVDRNIRIDQRWSAAHVDRLRRYAAELVALAPHAILGGGATAVRSLQEVTDKVPIVFAGVTDPAGAGLVASVARPGGNSTGFANFEYGMSTKWLELLKKIAPGVTRAGVIRDPSGVGGGAQFGAIQSVASSLAIEVSPIDARDAGGVERAITTFARSSNSGLIVTSSRFATVHRKLLITIAARHRLPVVYPYRYYVVSGGLVS